MRSLTVRWRLIGISAFAVAATTGIVLWQKPWKKAAPAEPVSPPAETLSLDPPQLTPSRYLNTLPDATYVGSSTCADCHRNEHKSYRLTPHSRALADLDPKVEPPDATFFHKASKRHYRVYRDGNQFRHEEVLRSAEGKEIVRVDQPIRYLIGSGNFCRSYLFEVDGFLHESPLTWYTGRKEWDMSPGYDFAQHWGFERPVTLACLACHAGRVESQGNAVNRLTIHEQSIGCESCHGPGSKHVEFRKSDRRLADDEDDLTIVNPGRLSRARVESLCGACHLSGVAAIDVRGRKITDFRPGMVLNDIRVDYRFDTGNDLMSVVGHIEQLRLSACYQKSEMTCLTCHDPHAREKPADTVAFHRRKCMNCHSTMPCKLDHSERIKNDGTDNCVACHMPRGDTDIPHIAFHHHRIGKHTKAAKSRVTGVADLAPTDDDSHLPKIDRRRNLALAYLEVARKPQYSKFADTYRNRGFDILNEVYAAGLRDGETLKTLATLYFQKDLRRTTDLTRQALAAPDLPSESHAPMLLLMADCHMQVHDYNAAIALLEQLVRLRRFAEDWRVLALCHLRRREPQQAIHALKTAISIRPYRHDLHGMLAEAYGVVGDSAHAKDHLEKARWLYEHEQE